MLTAVCLRSFTRGGYLLQVDIVFGPRPGPVTPGLGAPVSALQSLAVDLLGGDVAGRIYAAGVLFLAGFAPMVLLRHARWYAQCVAGILGALNPWVYARMVEGQWTLVAGAAGLFLWVAAWEALQARPGPRRAALLAVVGGGTAAFSPHMVAPIVVLAIIGGAWSRIWRERNRITWTAWSFAMLGLLLAPGALWFFFGEQERAYESVKQFTAADFTFFRSTSSDDYGLFVNLLGLYGYWGERLGRFPLASDGAAWWPLTTAIVVGAAVVGAVLDRARAWLLPCGLVGLAVSASTALPSVREAVVWLAERVPFVGVYREPQKWSALWLLAVATLAAGAVDQLAQRSDTRRRLGAAFAPAVAYLVALAALFPAGVAQIRAIPPIVKPLEYPRDWSDTRAYLAATVAPREPVVVLPWHLYQSLSFTEGRLVANPARVFFPGRVIVPRNLEIPGRPTEITTPFDRIGLVVAGAGHRRCALATEVRNLGVRWMLVLDAAEGRQAVRALVRCGASLVRGRPGRTAVLRFRKS
ncbi:MAG TPA: hypothetical protein VFA34_16145 [Actinomycetota bacterium]|nr:hypothetical protein [Actinomycetota bacterium]